MDLLKKILTTREPAAADLSEHIAFAAALRKEQMELLPRQQQLESELSTLRPGTARSREIQKRVDAAFHEVRRCTERLKVIEVRCLLPVAKEQAEADVVQAAGVEKAAQDKLKGLEHAWSQRQARRDVAHEMLQAKRQAVDAIDLRAKADLQEATSGGDESALAAAAEAYRKARKQSREAEDEASIAEVQFKVHDRVLSELAADIEAARASVIAATDALSKARTDVHAVAIDEAGLDLLLALLQFGHHGGDLRAFHGEEMLLRIGASRHLLAVVPGSHRWVCDLHRPGVVNNMVERARVHRHRDLIFTEPEAHDEVADTVAPEVCVRQVQA